MPSWACMNGTVVSKKRKGWIDYIDKMVRSAGVESVNQGVP